MSGYYPGTYGFENDEDGAFPEEWSSSDFRHCAVIDSLDYHEDVFSIGDSGNEGNVYTEFEPQISGNIEFWFRAEPNTQTSFYLYDIPNHGKNALFSGNLNLVGNDGSWVFSGSSTSGAKANKWYHLKFEFNKDLNSILIYIDNILVQTHIYNILGNINCLCFKSDGSFIDAVDFSWTGGYYDGRNKKEGFLLDFESYYDLEQVSFQLLEYETSDDFESISTISTLGDKVIPMPNNGPCTIVVYGINPKGEPLTSDTIQFSVDYNRQLSIKWPKIKTYTKFASYEFQLLFEKPDGMISMAYTIDGQTPVEILDYQEIGNCLIQAEIPIPNQGTHQIQVFATDSEGYSYNTEIKEFNLDLKIEFKGIDDSKSYCGGSD
ncbi:MAG: hypothetical protein FK734_19450, partial [Asgard group archaeon]|nr:hypothetical protein [Asgard group archaeon]